MSNRANRLLAAIPFPALIGIAIGSFAVLVISGLGVWRSYQASTTTATLPSVEYTQTGEFDYVATLAPSTLYGDRIEEESGPEAALQELSREPPTLVFFRDITEELDLYYSSSFQCSEPLALSERHATVSIVVGNPGMWSKEAQRFFEDTHSSWGFQMRCPLDIDRVEWVAEEVSKDVGIEARELELDIEATVVVKAITTGGVVIEEEYTHCLEGELQEKTLKLTGSLDSHEEGSSGDVTYAHDGRFDYEAWLNYNELYDTQVLRSEPLPVATPVVNDVPAQPPTQVGPGSVLFTQLLDTVEGSFYYTLDSEAPLDGRRHEVDVMVVVENPGVWQKEFAIVENEVRSGNFGITFPIEITTYIDEVEDIERETGVVANDYALRLVADIHTTAETELGRLHESFTQVLEGKLMGNMVNFTGELAISENGVVGGGEVPGTGESAGWRTGWLLGVVLGGLGLVLSVRWLQAGGVGRPGESERAVRAALSRHHQLLAGACELPPVPAGTTIVRMDSVDALARIARDSAEPLVYVRDGNRHVFLVLKSGTRYEHVVGD